FLALITSEMDLRRVQSALPATVWAQVGPEAQERLAAGDSAVIVAYLGEFPTGGYAIRVRRVTVQAAETEGDLPVVTVTVARRQPAPGEFVIQAFTYPYDFVVVPKSSLPGEPYRVQFVDDDGNELNGGTSSPLGGPRRPSEREARGAGVRGYSWPTSWAPKSEAAAGPAATRRYADVPRRERSARHTAASVSPPTPT